MDILLILWTMICAIISVGCVMYAWKLRIDIGKKKDHMMRLRDEIVDHANIATELVKSMAVDLENMRPKAPHMPTVEEINQVLRDSGNGEEVLNVSSKADFLSRFKKMTKKAHEDLAKMEDKDNSDNEANKE